VHAPGDEIEAARIELKDGVRWVVTKTGAWVEAARLDRVPQPTENLLTAGKEGMADGRVLPDDYEPADLVVVPDSLKATDFGWRPMSLRSGALRAFRSLITAADSAGFEIRIFSAYRSAEYQRGLYARAVERDPTQNRSAPPGRSEHRLGTAVDVAVPGVPLLSGELEHSPAGRWLAAHCEASGIVVSYSHGRHRARGVAFEPWHLRWVGENVRDEGDW
jgi:LAS superfamily LD-carboxypeptidase LdcB